MITLSAYLGPWINHPDVTPDVKENAMAFLVKVCDLLDEADRHYVELEDNPNTGTLVSGKTYGGFRPQDCPQGAPHSSHKAGRGVDIYDPHNALDNWITDTWLEKFGLYREATLSTLGWCHLTDRAPNSGNRTFQP